MFAPFLASACGEKHHIRILFDTVANDTHILPKIQYHVLSRIHYQVLSWIHYHILPKIHCHILPMPRTGKPTKRVDPYYSS